MSLAFKLLIDKDDCTGCGTCAGICSKEIVHFFETNTGILRPEFNKKECSNCSLCVKACPAINLDFDSLNMQVFGKIPKDGEIGNYLEIFQGYATDQKIRYLSSSGGLATIIIQFLLDQKYIDAALLVNASSEHPTRPFAFLATSSEQINSSSGSKYCPVALNVQLSNIIKNKLKVAVVGLPCHIHGIRLAIDANRKLSEQVVISIGLFCGKTPTFEATDSLLDKLKISEERIRKLAYRGKGWPGFFQLSGQQMNVKIDFSLLWKSYIGSAFFESPHCFRCYDFFSDFADISLGDAWLDSISGDNTGRSIVITRTVQGENIIDEIMQENKINLSVVSPGELKDAFAVNLIHKKRHNFLRLKKIKNRFNDSNFCSFNKIYDKLYVRFQRFQISLGQNQFVIKHLLSFPPTLFMKCVFYVEEKLRILILLRPTVAKTFIWFCKRVHRKFS